MNKPHIDKVVEVLLASVGFMDSRQLSIRCTQLFDWCSQLSYSIGFYDFSVKSVMSNVLQQCAAGLRKGCGEHECMYRALWSSLLPQLTPKDSACAANQLRALFPGQSPDSNVMDPFQALPGPVHGQLEEIARQAGDTFEPQKLKDSFRVHEYTHSIGILTEAPHRTLNVLSMCAAAIGRQLVYIGYGHCRMGISYLYGKETDDGCWTDGVLTLAIRRAVEHKIPTWIVLDGPVTPKLMEPLHSLLDRRKRLWLPTSESIRVASSLRIIFLIDPASASSLSSETKRKLGRVNMLTQAESHAAILGKRKRAGECAQSAQVPETSLVRRRSFEPCWSVHQNIDMCGQGDVEIVSDWRSKTTIEALKWIVEQRGYSAFTVSNGEPRFGHAAIKKFDYQLTPAHCKPISTCCNHPCLIYIYHPDVCHHPDASTLNLSSEEPVSLQDSGSKNKQPTSAAPPGQNTTACSTPVSKPA